MKANFLFGALAALALSAALTACSKEDSPADNRVAQSDQVLYMKVAISNPADTRADFQDGTVAENKVASMYFKFYDINGKPVATESAENYTFVETTPGSQNVGQIATAVVQIELTKGKNYPSYVMCFINPVNWDEINEGSNISMQDLRNKTRDNYLDNSKWFSMSNSVYYGDDAATGAANVKMSGTPINPSALYTSQSAAESADAASTVDIYVERYAAKVQFTLDPAAIEAYSTDNGYTLTFEPEAWTVNADAAAMYAIKRFATEEGDDAPIPSLSEINTMLGTWNSWNAPALHRSYWSCSPSYYATAFPQVSDNIVDLAKEEDKGTGEGKLVGDYQLKYYSYKHATTKGMKNWTADEHGVKPCTYTLENTMSKTAFTSINPKAAAPSVLLVGKYIVKNGETAIGDGAKFYLYNNYLYFDAPQTGTAENAVTMKERFFNANQILAIDENGTLLQADNASSVAGNFDIQHPEKKIRGNQAVPQRFVTLQLTTAPTANLYYKPNGSSAWIPVTEAHLDQINTLLWQQLGNAYAYTDAKAYFSIPIRHLGATENPGYETVFTDKGIEWSKARIGDFGLVRNHVYTIQVDGIKGLATGINKLDNPIVPPMENDNYYIKYSINVLNWRIVPVQGGIIL